MFAPLKLNVIRNTEKGQQANTSRVLKPTTNFQWGFDYKDATYQTVITSFNFLFHP